MKPTINEIDRHIDLTGIAGDDLWCPDIANYQEYVDVRGIVYFNLPPYSMTQMVTAQDKLDWFYVDTGSDGHAVRTFDLARKVLEQTMRMAQVAELDELRRIQTADLEVIIVNGHAQTGPFVPIGKIPREKVPLFFDQIQGEFGFDISLSETKWLKNNRIDIHVYEGDSFWYDIVRLTKWVIEAVEEHKS